MNCDEGTHPLGLWFHSYINTPLKTLFPAAPFCLFVMQVDCGDHPDDKNPLYFPLLNEAFRPTPHPFTEWSCMTRCPAVGRAGGLGMGGSAEAALPPHVRTHLQRPSFFPVYSRVG